MDLDRSFNKWTACAKSAFPLLGLDRLLERFSWLDAVLLELLLLLFELELGTLFVALDVDIGSVASLLSMCSCYNYYTFVSRSCRCLLLLSCCCR
jgi:hypothetical protein